MRAVDAIVERRIDEARQLGYFDDLEGAGKPIPDLDTPRSDGWWAERYAKKERHQLLREELITVVRRALPAIRRGADADGVADLNARIDGYNRITTVTALPPVDLHQAWEPYRTAADR
ncbi:MAG: DnaJ family domain-containing protein [Actinomycetota bacterium]